MRYKKINPFEEKEEKEKPKYKKWLNLFISLVVFGGIYIFCVQNEIKGIVYCYYAILILTFIAFIILNRGFSSRDLDIEQLPENWDEERKLRFIEKDKARRKYGKYLLYIVIPLLLIFAGDIIYMAFLS